MEKTIATAPPPSKKEEPKVKVKIKSTTLQTPKLSDHLLGSTKLEKEIEGESDGTPFINKEYSEEALQAAWDNFAEQKKALRAEFQLLSQPFQKEGHLITITLHNPIEETLLDNIKSDLIAFLRETLKNQEITVKGELIHEEHKKMMYTNKEKFEHLMEKNPILKELKDRLGLDPDF